MFVDGAEEGRFATRRTKIGGFSEASVGDYDRCCSCDLGGEERDDGDMAA